MNALRSSPFALPLAVLLAACGTHAAATGGTGGRGGEGTSSSASVGTTGSSTSAGGAGGTGGEGGASASSSGGGATTTTTAASTSASSSSGTATPPCPCYDGNGAYCETGAASYASSHDCSIGSGSSDDLLSCNDASWTVSKSCANGCTVEPAGQPDQCTATTPCPCYDGDGLYCQTGAASYASSHGCSIGSGNSDDLLSCSGSSWTVSKSCANGCTVEPAGQNDQCTASCNGLSLSAFISKFTGMCTGYPGWSPPNQCTDLALQWVANLCLPVQFSGNAINWAGESVQGFTWVENAPGIVPSPGDLVVFGPVGMTCDDGVGSDGHVDICVSASATSSDWTGFDQNWETDWNGTCYPPQIVDHNWSECVIGWQHLTAPVP